MKLPKVNPREKKLLAVTAAAIVAFVAYSGVVTPLWELRQRQHADVAGLQADLARYRQSLREGPQIEQRYASMEIDLHQRRSKEEEISSLLQDLRRKYGSLPLVDKGTRVQPTEEQDSYRKFRVQLELEGPVPAMAELIGAISTAKEPLKVEQMTLRSVPSDGKQEMVHGSIVVSALYVLGTPPSGESKSRILP